MISIHAHAPHTSECTHRLTRNGEICESPRRTTENTEHQHIIHIVCVHTQFRYTKRARSFEYFIMAINLCAAMFVFGGRVADRAGTLMRRPCRMRPRKMNCYYIVVCTTVKEHLPVHLKLVKARGHRAVAEHTQTYLLYIYIHTQLVL